MAGPTCEVLLEIDDGTTIDALDSVLAALSHRIERTRKGRVWDVWVGGRPVHVNIPDGTAVVELSAGCNSLEDYAVLRRITGEIIAAIGGLASQPEK